MAQRTRNSARRATPVLVSAVLGFTVLGLTVLGLTGCGAGADASGADAMAELTSQVKEQQRLSKALLDSLDRIERTLDGHTQDIDRLSRDRVATELAAVSVAARPTEDAAAAAADAAPVAGLDVAALLETEDGQAAVEKAMAVVQQKRDAERRERWVGAMVDRFAADANLSDAQTDDMRRIVSGSFKKIGELWSGMRGGDGVTAGERTLQREEAMLKVEEIRQETNDEVKAVLSPDQYALYEEQAARMRGFGGGRGMRGRGGR